MFIKRLLIQSETETIRDIKFHSGLNLIVDATENNIQIKERQTGNSIGKTTVLKLIDYCLGGDKKEVYTDPENKGNIDSVVNDFLIKSKILVTLILADNLEEHTGKEYKIQRNFLLRKEKICKIDNVIFNDSKKKNSGFSSESDFDLKLKEIMFPGLKDTPPTFRQLIAHNIRYKDIRINNTIKYLDAFSKDFEYENLFLYLLGCPTNNSEEKLALQTLIKQEKSFIKRLFGTQDENGYRYAMKVLESDITKLKKQRSELNVNPEFKKDLERLDANKIEQNTIASLQSTYNVKVNIIIKSISEIRKSQTDIHTEELKKLYDEASNYIGELPTKFEELVRYHNTVLKDRSEFLAKEKDNIRNLLLELNSKLSALMQEEKRLASIVKKSGTLEEFEELSNQLNSKFLEKGRYENILTQIRESSENLNGFKKEVLLLEQTLFSKEFEKKVEEQIVKFNAYFSSYSQILYGESYMLKHEIKKTNNNQKFYDFKTYTMAISSGKKQGEILAFDLAYIMFANDESIPHVNFLLNDKKELMYNQQIIDIFSKIDVTKIQVVFPILKEKIPAIYDNDAYVILKLTDEDKLFRIEK